MQINRMQQKEQKGKGKSQSERQCAEEETGERQGKKRGIMKIIHRLLCWVPIPEDVETVIWWPQIGRELHPANRELIYQGHWQELWWLRRSSTTHELNTSGSWQWLCNWILLPLEWSASLLPAPSLLKWSVGVLWVLASGAHEFYLLPDLRNSSLLPEGNCSGQAE